MAIMAPAAPEQALMGLTGCCNTGPAFVATETKNSPCPIQSLGSSSAFLNWPALQPMANSHSTMASPLGSPSPWEHLLNYPGGGFEELPLWSSKAAEGHDGILQAPAKSGIATASSAVLQPQVLEAVEGTRTGANMDALVASVAAAPHENDRRAPCSEGVHQAGPSSTTAASPARSPLRLRDHHPATNSRKRKKDRSSHSPKRSEQEGKRCGRESGKSKGRERSCSETSGESGGRGKEKNRVRKKQQQQQQECSKQDYIHVRARRGQATDSHSLAERVRREKMSERMKFLQDLVPGCRKVTGKAVMLDEIINYVQSLQRQVENLSMKLASVSPTQSSHWTLESLLSNKEILQSQFSNTMAFSCAPRPFGMMQPPPAVGVQQQPGLQLPFGFDFRSSCNGNGLEHVSRNATTLSPPIAALADLTPLRPFDTNVPQFTGRDGELQSVVHMGLHQQDQLGSFAGHLHGRLPVGRMKVEF